MNTETHTIMLSKLSERRLRESTKTNNLTDILKAVSTKSLNVAGWSITADTSGHEDTAFGYFDYDGGPEDRNVYRTEMYLKVTFEHPERKPDNRIFQSICRTIDTRASTHKFGRWQLTEVDHQPYETPDDNAVPLAKDFVGYTDVTIPDDYEDHFSHLYGLESHVTRIKRAFQIGAQSDWLFRYHCALIGPPGCGKSDICGTIKRMLGEDAVLEFDATATTAAGAIKELAEREILPRILIVEEIEKADEKALTFLLALLDQRSEIRKTTARETIQRDTKLFCIATVNNTELFEKLAAGALASRFANKVFFRRPDRAQLKMILEREVRKIGGDEAWIDPTLDYADSIGLTDPRAVTAICLCGRDMLVTGEYQKVLADTGDIREMGSEDWTV